MQVEFAEFIAAFHFAAVVVETAVVACFAFSFEEVFADWFGGVVG